MYRYLYVLGRGFRLGVLRVTCYYRLLIVEFHLIVIGVVRGVWID